jgi:hypothetical protein
MRYLHQFFCFLYFLFIYCFSFYLFDFWLFFERFLNKKTFSDKIKKKKININTKKNKIKFVFSLVYILYCLFDIYVVDLILNAASGKYCAFCRKRRERCNNWLKQTQTQIKLQTYKQKMVNKKVGFIYCIWIFVDDLLYFFCNASTLTVFFSSFNNVATYCLNIPCKNITKKIGNNTQYKIAGSNKIVFVVSNNMFVVYVVVC